MTRSDYTPPTFTDVPQSQWGNPPAGAVALDSTHLNAMAQAIANSAVQYAVNVKDYGAKGDGATDDATAINAAITAATAAGGVVIFPVGVYLCGNTITLPSGVHLRGSGIGGDIFSTTDGTLPFRGTVLKLKNGANADLIKTANFATLTGQSSPSGSATPSRFGLHDLVLDGNKQGNTAGIPLRIFGRAYEVDHVIIQNGATGGVYSEYGSGGYEMEARWSNFTITDCAGDGLAWKGPHDSQFVNGLVARNDGHVGINLGLGGWVGGEMFANVHVWGNHTYQWAIGTQNSAFLNCVSDGPGGVQVTGNGNQWIGGAIYGSAVPGENAITVGDGTTRTVGGNVFRTRCFNYSSGSLFNRILANTATDKNTYQVTGNFGGATRYAAGAGKSTTTGALTFPVTTVPVASGASFPTGGGTLYLGDGTTVVTANYTGVSGNTLTGVSGGSGTLASGAAVFSQSATISDDTWEVLDRDNPGTNGLFQTAQTNQNSTFLNATTFSVGVQMLRPNSSTAALQHKRNETGRVDLNWDNSGTAGVYSFQNSAVVEGRTATDPSTMAWRLNSTLGTITCRDGNTSGRPSAVTAGIAAMFYDSTLHKPIWSDGTSWRDAAGTVV